MLDTKLVRAAERGGGATCEQECRIWTGGKVSHVVSWGREKRRRRMGLIGWFKKFPPSQPVLLQYSLKLRKIAAVRSDPTQLGTACPSFTYNEGGGVFFTRDFVCSGLF
jgi:hypothetical protein